MRGRAGTVAGQENLAGQAASGASDHSIAERSKNYRCSADHQGVIVAGTRLVLVVGRPLAGNRNDRKAWQESGAKCAA